MLVLWLVLVGLAIGSFLNVVIARLPADRSLVAPGSSCPTCGARIAWYDNIPLLSFAVLRGRCRACATRISWRYPVVEAVTGALFGMAAVRFDLTPQLPLALLLIALLVAVTGIDLRQQMIPDAITLPGTVVGLVLGVATGRVSWLDSVAGIAAGGTIFLAIIVASRGGMGGGDLKLAAMLGAFLGWQVMLLSILIAVLAGGAVAVVLLASGRTGRKDPIPFGPFLAAGGVIGLFWGPPLLEWYLSAFTA